MYFQPPAQRFLPSQVEISNTIRSLFVDNARWLRNMILSEVLNLPNKDAIKERLDQVAYDASVLFSRFYGQEEATRAQQIYLDYFDNVHDLIEAYLKNDITDIEQHRANLYQDVDEFSQLLSRVNRYWDYETLRTLFYIMVNDTINQIENIVRQEFQNDIAAYDQFFNQIYRVSDELTYGILKQFPL